MLNHRRTPVAAMLVAACLLTACGRDAPDTATTDEAQQPAVADVTAESGQAALPRTASAEGAKVYFVAPADGATVTNPVRIEFGIEGMSVVTAGDDSPHSGHHHLIVDAGLPDLSLPIPANENYIHFGDGSTSTELTLEPGSHTLQLLLGDHLHIPHDPPVTSETITITVE